MVVFRTLFSPRRPAAMSEVLIAAVVAVLLAAPAAHAQSDRRPAVADATLLPLPTVEEVKSVADTLENIRKSLDLIRPAIPRSVFDPLNDVTDYAKDFGDLALALRLDMAEHLNPAANNSHTVQALATIAQDRYTGPDRLQDLKKLGLISKVAVREFGFLSFGASDVAEGVGTMAGQRSVGNVEAVEKVLDGISGTAWGIYGFALTGNWQVAQAYATASGLMAGKARDLTLPAFQQMAAKLSGVDDKIVGLWEEAQKVRIAHGQRPEPIEQFYSGKGEAATLALIGPAALAQADARLGLANQFERRTVEHYQQTCINGYCSRIDLSAPSNASREQPLGGVRLDQPLTGAAVRGVKIDAANGNIILLGERDFLARGLKLRDFAMALWLVFGPQAQDPAFSLDPDDTRNPQGPWLRARYVPDMLQGRSFGADLFAADLLLKELSFHVMLKPDGKLEEWQSAVPGFHSYAELAMADVSDDSRQQQWARFWIVVDQITSRQAGDTWLFEARMAVKARRQEPDLKSPTGLRDIDTDPASLEARWARIATDHYDELAAESPAFARVREMAVAIGIAKSLKVAGARVDLARVADLLNADHTGTVAKINAFSVGWQRRSETPYRDGDRQGVRTETRELHLFGGVDLGVKPRAAPDDDGKARGMDDAAGTAFRMAGQTGIVRFEYGGSRLVAVAIPLLVKQGSAAPN